LEQQLEPTKLKLVERWFFATLNVSTFSQKCGFETDRKGINLVNLGFGGTVNWAKLYLMSISTGIIYSIKDTLRIFSFKTDGIQTWKKHRFGVNLTCSSIVSSISKRYLERVAFLVLFKTFHLYNTNYFPFL
jgi:hypothetical protein